MSKHTPGPWYTAVTVGNDIAILGQTAGNVCVIRIIYPHRSEQEQIANARLIAAAPDLLAVLQLALKEHDEYEAGQRIYDAWVEPARAAIAKAMGGCHE